MRDGWSPVLGTAMEQILQLLVQQQAAAAERTKQQGAHIAGLLQLQVQATEQVRGIVEENRRALVQPMEQSSGASAACLVPSGMLQMTQDDDLEFFLGA